MLVLTRNAGQKVTGVVTLEGLEQLLDKARAAGAESISFSIENCGSSKTRFGLTFPEEFLLDRDDRINAPC